MEKISQATIRHIPNAGSLPYPVANYDDDLADIAALAASMTHSAKKNVDKMPTGNKPDPRGYRKQFTFWLCEGHDWQVDMGRWLLSLKKRRQFAPTIHNALLLYRELRECKVDLLFKMFPWVKDHLTPPPPAAPEMDELKRKIELLERLVLAQQGGPQPAAKPLATLPAPPADDDDTLIVSIDQDAGKRSCENFIASAFALQSVGEKRQ